jgi:prepilin-type N-terminal cleavage/methylation domain-containing protein
MQRSKSSGFTLVELLVVIGIIGLLVAILLPALNRAREQAVSVQCMSNLRACGQLLYIYANQNHGMFPMMKIDESQQFPRNKSDVSTTNLGVTFKYPDIKSAMAQIANPHSNPYDTPFFAGGLKVFYCPANWFWDAEQNLRSHQPDDFMKDSGGGDTVTGCLTYWYFGNPDPWYPQYHYPGPFGGAHPGSAPATATGALDWRFWDTNGNGDNRDEYVIKLGEKGMQRKVLMTDQGRQTGGQNLGSVVGFQFVHGPHSNPLRGWQNNLYADDHVESKKANAASFSADRTQFINLNPSPDEVQPRWGNATQYEMW